MPYTLYFLALHQQRHLRQIERVYQEWQQSHQTY